MAPRKTLWWAKATMNAHLSKRDHGQKRWLLGLQLLKLSMYSRVNCSTEMRSTEF